MKDIFDDLFISEEQEKILELKKLEEQFIVPDIVAYCHQKAVDHHKIALHYQEQYFHFKALKVLT